MCLPVAAKESAGSEFLVTAVLPENQINQDNTYFDLKMEPSQEQIVEVQIWNLTDEEIQIKPQIHSATTNMNGVVEYGANDTEPDDTLPYPMEEIITCDNLVAVPANGTEKLKLHIQMPEEQYKGILAGGITFELVGRDETEAKGAEERLAIQNVYSYVIGIVLTEDTNEVKPELVINSVFYDKTEDTVWVNLQNIEAAYVYDLEITARITRKGTTGTLYQASGEDMRMAPNSNFNFPISLDGKLLNDGEFTLYITARSAEEEWIWEKDFTIDGGKISTQSDSVFSGQMGFAWLLAVVPIVLLAAGIMIFRYKKTQAIIKDLKPKL